jgi:ATP-dependent Lon protease
MPIPASDALPLFPLGLVLYPGEVVPLHIFEERYRDLVRYCLETEDPFGVVWIEEDEIARVGCTARIERVLQRYEDGRLDIVAVGEERFQIEEVKQERLYLTAQVASYETPEGVVDPTERERVITLHMKLLELAGETIRPAIYEGPKRISYIVAQNAGLDLARKQEVLELPTEEERLTYLGAYLEQIIPEVREARERRRKVQSNGHFPEGESTSDE